MNCCVCTDIFSRKHINQEKINRMITGVKCNGLVLHREQF